MGPFGCVYAGDANGDLESGAEWSALREKNKISPQTAIAYAYRLALQNLFLCGHMAHPAPASPSSAGGVEQMEAVAITNTGDLAKEGPIPVLVGVNVLDARYAAQQDSVEFEATKQDGGHHNGRHPSPRVPVLFDFERVIPTDAFGRLLW